MSAIWHIFVLCIYGGHGLTKFLHICIQTYPKFQQKMSGYWIFNIYMYSILFLFKVLKIRCLDSELLKFVCIQSLNSFHSWQNLYLLHKNSYCALNMHVLFCIFLRYLLYSALLWTGSVPLFNTITVWGRGWIYGPRVHKTLHPSSVKILVWLKLLSL